MRILDSDEGVTLFRDLLGFVLRLDIRDVMGIDVGDVKHPDGMIYAIGQVYIAVAFRLNVHSLLLPRDA